jgi:hypothetical protein
MVTYQRVYNENEYGREGRNGRIYTGVIGWVYEVREDGEYIDNFKTLREVKKIWPNAIRRPKDN